MTKIENLPAKLRETGLFCCWRYEEGEGDKKPRKVPYNPRTGGRAQSNNPDTFAPHILLKAEATLLLFAGNVSRDVLWGRNISCLSWMK